MGTSSWMDIRLCGGLCHLGGRYCDPMVAPRTWDPNLLCIVPGRSFRSRGRGRRQRRSDSLGIGHSTRLVGVHAPHLRVQSSDAGRDRCHENFFAFRPVAALRSRMLARPHLPERSMTAERKPSTAGQPPAIPSGSSPYFLMRRPLSTSTPAFGTRMNM